MFAFHCSKRDQPFRACGDESSLTGAAVPLQQTTNCFVHSDTARASNVTRYIVSSTADRIRQG